MSNQPQPEPQKARLLIIDDDANTLASLARAFRLAGHEAVVSDSAARALELIKSQSFDLIFSDVVMPGKDGLSFLEDCRALGLTTPVVMMSGQAHIEMAVRATRLGALDFLEKPLSTDKLLLTVENALKLKRLEQENRELRQRVGRQDIIFTGEAMRKMMAQAERVAASETRVCILGETGTGKELVARTLHEHSPRRNGPFVTLNCAAVPAELVESELFGHEKGAFTGAATRHAGKFEQAERGTLFLDEIGDMPLAMQAKLLRVLEQNEIERVGGERPVAVDVRVIVATHRRLESLVQEGKFREDLYHRIYVYPLALPALRERREDIPALVEHFTRQITEQNGWKPVSVSADAIELLQAHAWPGNVRELRNVVERLLLLASDNQVDAAVVSAALPDLASTASPDSLSASGPLSGRVEGFERNAILTELKAQQYHVTHTAEALGLERSHLYKKCQQLGIDLQSLRKQG
ncbi:MAG TPA: sigma-54 dependent transcriptional regulator [Terriglobales bacterium]|nr:sigma-54 dependent transcriptional regulator [Terriglobales bacterium]